MAPIFTVDWETYFNAVIPKEEWWKFSLEIEEPTHYLLSLFEKHKIKSIFYVLGWLKNENPDLFNEIVREGHKIGSHGYWHERNEHQNGLFRSPYWDKTPIPWPPSGGFFFRFMPFWYIKWAIKRSGMFWIHPHDIMKDHPRLDDSWLNWKRHVGIRNSRAKLERLLKEVKFSEPR